MSKSIALMLVTLMTANAFASAPMCAEILPLMKKSKARAAQTPDQAQPPTASSPADANKPDAQHPVVGTAHATAKDQPVEQVAKEIGKLVTNDYQNAEEYFKYIDKLIETRKDIDRYRNWSGDSLDIDEYTFLDEKQAIQTALKNGDDEGLYNLYRTKFQEIEWVYFKLLVNLGKIKSGEYNPGDTPEAVKEQTNNYYKFFAKNWVEYKKVRSYLEAVTAYAADVDPTAPDKEETPAQQKARKKLRNFASEIRQKPKIAQVATDVNNGLRLTKVKNGIPVDKIPPDLFDVDMMQKFFDSHRENMQIYLDELKKDEKLNFFVRLLQNEKVQKFIINVAEKSPPLIKQILQFWVGYNKQAANDLRFKNVLNKIMDSTGEVEDKVEQMLTQAGKSGNEEGTYTLTTEFKYIKDGDKLMKTVMFARKRVAPLSDEVISTSYSDASGLERDPYASQIDKIKNDSAADVSTVKVLDTIVENTGKVNSFLLYAARWPKTRYMWGEMMKYLYQKRADEAAFNFTIRDGDVKMFENAARIAVKMGTSAPSDLPPVSLMRFTAVSGTGAVGAALWLISPWGQHFLATTFPHLIQLAPHL